MELVTDPDEARQIDHTLAEADFCDLVLDDGSYVPNSAVLESRAFGIVIGGQTGFLPFAGIPGLASRRIQHILRLSRVHRIPLLGSWLRHSWASRVGGRLTKPSWIPKL